MSVRNIDDLFALFRKHKVFERFFIQRIGVFGSLARGEQFNDIDLLIEDDLGRWREGKLPDGVRVVGPALALIKEDPEFVKRLLKQ